MKRKKLLFLFLLFSIIAFWQLEATAAEQTEHIFEFEGLKYKVLDEETKTCEVSINENASGEIIIPQRVDDGTTTYIVTAVGDNAFHNCSKITSVVFEADVLRIGKQAFGVCTALEAVMLDSYSLEVIDDAAFVNCESLKLIVIPSKVSHIGTQAFGSCNSLEKINIPNSVKTIGSHPLNLCRSLKEISIDSPNISISDLMNSIYSDRLSVILENSITKIGTDFFNAYSLYSITIPESITEIEENAFVNCWPKVIKYQHPISTPENIFSDDIYHSTVLYTDGSLPSPWDKFEQTRPFDDVPLDQFEYEGMTYEILDQRTCKLVKSSLSGMVEIPSIVYSLDEPYIVTSIDRDAFNQLNGITSLILPETITNVGLFSFFNSNTLETISLPQSLEYIGAYAFECCYNIKEINYNTSNPITASKEVFYSKLYNNGWMGHHDSPSIFETTKLIVPPGSIEKFKQTSPWKYFNKIIEKGQEENSSVKFTYSGTENNFVIGVNDSQTLTLSLENAELANGFQADITLPAGLSIAETAGKIDVYLGKNAVTESHVISAAKVEGVNKYRVIVYSSKNEAFNSGENLLNINIVSGNSQNGGDITIDNTVISLADGDNYTPDGLNINVPEFISVSQIILDNSEATINLGSTIKFNAEVYPANARVKTLIWSSSDESVATVNEDGVVTPVTKGTVVIIATSTDGSGVSASATITITNYMQSLTIGNNISIEMDETMLLTPVFAPTNADATELVWSSSNAAVAYVNSNNVLHAVSTGTATITASNVASGLEASITVTVGAVLYGDSNDNGIVAIDDVVTDVQYILEKDPTPFNFKKADVNSDNAINIIDVSKTVCIILSDSPINALNRAPGVDLCSTLPGLTADDVTLTASHKTMTIGLGDVGEITALQSDIGLPEGVSISAISLAGEQQGDHSVAFAKVNDHCVRFAIYSLSLAKMNNNAPMIEVEFDYDCSFLDGRAEVYDIIASDLRSKMVRFDNLSVNISNGNTTGMDELLLNNVTMGDVYTIQGICVMHNASKNDINTLAPGIYIIHQGNQMIKLKI